MSEQVIKTYSLLDQSDQVTPAEVTDFKKMS
jgi:hypothetical protein